MSLVLGETATPGFHRRLETVVVLLKALLLICKSQTTQVSTRLTRIVSRVTFSATT